jgi:hypothetical protein
LQLAPWGKLEGKHGGIVGRKEFIRAARMSGGGGVAAGAGDRQPRVLKIRGCDVSFPHKPYPSQLAMMDKTIQALKNSQNVLLELPTGSGKSLSLLCAAAAWHAGAARELDQAQAQPAAADCALSCKVAECDAGDERTAPKKRREKPKRPPKVYIASRTHAQLAQLVRELRKSGYSNVHMQVLGSRDQYCINASVLKSDQPKAQVCKDLVNKNACRYVHGAPRLEKHDRLQEGGDLRIHDIEDLVSLGKRIGGCPYFASSSLAKEASFIFCPYSYLVDPMTRDAMGIELKDAAVIIDEAHNIEDVCREAAGLELKYDELVETCAHLERMLVSDEESDEAQNYVALESVVRGIKDHMQKWVPLLQSNGNHSLTQHVTSGEEGAAVMREVGVTEETLKPLHKFLDTALAKMEEQLQAIEHGGSRGESVQVMQGQRRAGAEGGRGGGQETRGGGQETPTAKALFMVKDILTKADMLFKNTDDYKMALQQRTIREPGGGGRGGRGGRRGGGAWGGGGRDRARLELTLSLWCLNPAVAFVPLSSQARMHTRMHTYTHAYTHAYIYTCIHACIHIHIGIHAYIHIHIGMHAYIYT